MRPLPSTKKHSPFARGDVLIVQGHGTVLYIVSTWYEQLEAIHDLDAAIVLGREALALCPRGYPDRSRSLANLAKCLRSLFARSKQLQDQDELLGLYAQLVHVTQIMSSRDFSAARAWTRVAESFQHPTLLLAYETSFQLLIQHLAIPVSTSTSYHPQKPDLIDRSGCIFSLSA